MGFVVNFVYCHIGVVLSACLPIKRSSRFVGVACADMLVRDLIAEVTVFQNLDIGYSFMINSAGNIFRLIYPTAYRVPQDAMFLQVSVCAQGGYPLASGPKSFPRSTPWPLIPGPFSGRTPWPLIPGPFSGGTPWPLIPGPFSGGTFWLLVPVPWRGAPKPSPSSPLRGQDRGNHLARIKSECCYAVDGKPLAVKQDDFLVYKCIQK